MSEEPEVPVKRKRGRPASGFATPGYIREANRRKRAKERQYRDGVGFLAETLVLLPGGFKDFFPYLRAASTRDERFVPVIEAMDKVPNGFAPRATCNRFEEVCKNLDLPISDIIGIAVGIAYEHKRDLTRYITALAMPEVMKRNIIEAKKPHGVEDRRMFMQSSGLLPVPKGSTINVSSSSQAASLTTGGEPTGLSTFESGTIEFSEVIRNAVESQRALSEPSLEVNAGEDGG